jgi:hypothetical protein
MKALYRQWEGVEHGWVVKFATEVFSRQWMKEIEDWARDNGVASYSIGSYSIGFYDEADAILCMVAFK